MRTGKAGKGQVQSRKSRVRSAGVLPDTGHGLTHRKSRSFLPELISGGMLTTGAPTISSPESAKATGIQL